MMSSSLQPLLDRIKAAREHKGLSQRALGERVGLPQSHISKIESGGVDLQASSLLEIARALDLELTLVPRATLPAIRALQNEPRIVERGTRKEVNRQLHALRSRVDRLAAHFPRSRIFARLRRTANELQPVPNAAADDGALRELNAALRMTHGELTQINRAIRNGEDIPAPVHRLKDLSELLTRLRHSIAPGVAPPAQQRPAYRLDDEEDGDG